MNTDAYDTPLEYQRRAIACRRFQTDLQVHICELHVPYDQRELPKSPFVIGNDFASRGDSHPDILKVINGEAAP